MKLEVYRFLEDDLSDNPFEAYEDIAGFMPLGETLLQVDVSEYQTVLISGYAKVVITRTDEDIENAKQEYERVMRKQESALLAAKYSL